ncbi:MAG TPA: hypothetical protein VF668_17115 [Pyrinomonadaceae bacterium]|jgi:hypothetical protein
MKRTVTLSCVIWTLLAAAAVCAQTGAPRAARPDAPAAAQPPAHGGKIESSYDGFARETRVALRRMGVTCEDVRGRRGALKGVCVSLQASLHCPGMQLDYVRGATLRLTFETKDWDSRHPAGERDLTAVADGETLRLGRMRLASQDVGEGWLAEDAKETLEVFVPYEAFLKLARASSVEMSVGKTAFPLREKNLAALRDMSARVNAPPREGAER